MGEDLIAATAARGPVGADGVDDGLGALAHLDGFVEVDAALVVVAVGDEDDRLANGLLTARDVEQLVAAGSVDGVKQRGAAAGAHAVDAGLERVDVVGPILRDGGGNIESHHKGAIALGLEDLQQKLDGGLLLELKAGTNRGAGIDDDAYTQRQIDLLAERGDLFRRLLVVEQRKVALLQIWNVVAVLVGHGEDEIDFVDADAAGWARYQQASSAAGRGLLAGSRRLGGMGDCAGFCEAGAGAGLGCRRGGCCACMGERRASATARTRPNELFGHIAFYFTNDRHLAAGQSGYGGIDGAGSSGVIKAAAEMQSSSSGKGASSCRGLPVTGCVNSSGRRGGSCGRDGAVRVPSFGARHGRCSLRRGLIDKLGRRAVEGVADDRVADGSHVYADLVGTAGFDADANQGEFAESCIETAHDFVVRDGGACVLAEGAWSCGSVGGDRG